MLRPNFEVVRFADCTVFLNQPRNVQAVLYKVQITGPETTTFVQFPLSTTLPYDILTVGTITKLIVALYRCTNIEVKYFIHNDEIFKTAHVETGHSGLHKVVKYKYANPTFLYVCKKRAPPEKRIVIKPMIFNK